MRPDNVFAGWVGADVETSHVSTDKLVRWRKVLAWEVDWMQDGGCKAEKNNGHICYRLPGSCPKCKL